MVKLWSSSVVGNGENSKAHQVSHGIRYLNVFLPECGLFEVALDALWGDEQYKEIAITWYDYSVA